jgi:putative nucleotidyltransferase with HDIG domain
METCVQKTILFVDDEESILDISRTYFESCGYHVLTASNGKQAVDLLSDHRVDCCLTDINMPEMDGLDLAEFIRKYDNTLPVVVMTGYPSLENTIKTLKNGVVDFLIKPVNLQQMELCVQRVLRERNLFVQNLILAKEVEGKAKLEQLNKELVNRVEELNTLNRIMTDFSAIRESADVFRQLVQMSVEIVKADTAEFYLIDKSGRYNLPIASVQAGTMTDAPADEQSNPSMKAQPANLSGNRQLSMLIQDVINEDQPLLIARNNNGSGMLPKQIQSFMLVPLKIRNKAFGVLSTALYRADTRFCEKDLYYLSFMTNKAAAAIENLALYENIYQNLLSTLYAFVKAIEARDPYTKQHSSRVTRLAITLARALNCSAEEQEILNVAGLLHDIGKIGIRDEILLKPGKLTPDEYRAIQQHPIIGAEIMDNLGLWNREKQIVRSHHERFDGKGYPDRLKGQSIPLLARILSVADVYDAIASDRAYRKRMAESQILRIMYEGAGTQFDPDIIDVFRKLYESGRIQQLDAETAENP